MNSQAAITKLLIIEGKGKIKTIKKLLPKDYEVLATGGHIMELANTGFNRAGVKPDGTLDKVLSSRGKQAMATINKMIRANHLDKIYIATDLDREGEAIGHDVWSQIHPKYHPIVKRIGYTEITKQAITNAINQPINFNQGLINAQHCRQGLDKLLGFTMSAFVISQTGGLSAGRVQSVALKIVKEREQAHLNYQPTLRYRLDVSINDDQNQSAPAHQYDDFDPKQRQKVIYEHANQVVEISGDKIECVAINELPLELIKPPKPYITSTILIQAANQLKLSTKQVSGYLQKLYESGLITYPRTDSITISQSFIDHARTFVSQNYGSDYCRPNPVSHKNKASAQEGHECIRVVDLNINKLDNQPNNDDHKWDEISNRLYQMIWKNSLVQLMSDAKKQSHENCFLSQNNLKFIVKNHKYIFLGWKLVYQNESDQNQSQIPTYFFKINHFYDYQQNVSEFDATSRPQLFSEASLIAYLEEHEIGRPSTYATYPNIIQERDYVYQNDHHRLQTTDKGKNNLQLLEQKFSEYVRQNYTAELEKLLDQVANNHYQYQKILIDLLAKMDAISQSFTKTSAPQQHDPFRHLKISRTFCFTCQAHRLIKVSKTSGAKMLICRNWKWDTTTKQASGCPVEWLKPK